MEEKLNDLLPNIKGWDFNQLNPIHAHKFQWEYKITPFSDLQTILIAVIIYYSSIIILKVFFFFFFFFFGKEKYLTL